MFFTRNWNAVAKDEGAKHGVSLVRAPPTRGVLRAQPEQQDGWVVLPDCIHPNKAPGHSAIRAMFWTAITRKRADVTPRSIAAPRRS
jgi:hypothetical protein